MFKKSFLVLTGILLLTTDQLLKFFLAHSLSPSESIPVINGIFHITLVLNTGCAFGLFKDKPNLFFLMSSFAVILFLICFFRRARASANAISKLAAALIISGSASNLMDRLRFGYVIDFLDFRVWPVFNLGDSAITVGVAIFILRLLCHPEGMKCPKDLKDPSLRSG